MWKSIAAFRVFVMSALMLFVFSMMPTLAKAQIPGRGLSLQILASQLKTSEQIAHYMWRNLRFETDRAHFGQDEYWQSPKETLASKKGDCEDFALFAQTLLKMTGRTAFLLNIHGVKYLCLHFALTKAATDLNKTIRQSRFTVIYMGNDGKVSNMF